MSPLGCSLMSLGARTMSIGLFETKGNYLLAGRGRMMMIEKQKPHAVGGIMMGHSLALSHRESFE